MTLLLYRLLQELRRMSDVAYPYALARRQLQRKKTAVFGLVLIVALMLTA